MSEIGRRIAEDMLWQQRQADLMDGRLLTITGTREDLDRIIGIAFRVAKAADKRDPERKPLLESCRRVSAEIESAKGN